MTRRTGLGLRATAHILSSSSPLEAFTNFTSSFPLLASHLSTLVPTIPEELEEEVGIFQMSSPLSQRPAFYLNGMPLPESSVDPFALLRSMRRERKIVTDIQGLSSHMKTKQARDVLMHEGIGAAAVGGTTSKGRDAVLTPDVLGDVFDAGDKQEGGGLVLWWNDLEKDKRYKTWSKDLKDVRRFQTAESVDANPPSSTDAPSRLPRPNESHPAQPQQRHLRARLLATRWSCSSRREHSPLCLAWHPHSLRSCAPSRRRGRR